MGQAVDALQWMRLGSWVGMQCWGVLERDMMRGERLGRDMIMSRNNHHKVKTQGSCERKQRREHAVERKQWREEAVERACSGESMQWREHAVESGGR